MIVNVLFETFKVYFNTNGSQILKEEFE